MGGITIPQRDIVCQLWTFSGEMPIIGCNGPLKRRSAVRLPGNLGSRLLGRDAQPSPPGRSAGTIICTCRTLFSRTGRASPFDGPTPLFRKTIYFLSRGVDDGSRGRARRRKSTRVPLLQGDSGNPVGLSERNRARAPLTRAPARDTLTRMVRNVR